MKKILLLIAFAGFCLKSSAQTSVDPGTTPGNTGTVTFNYQGQQVTLTSVRSADGNIWLQQNLGSTQVATVDNDALSYGHYFQWGRWDDGHQLPAASVVASSTLTANDPTGLGTGNTNFITTWWSAGTSSNTWSGSATPGPTAGKDPCIALGAGWHLPSGAEILAMYTAEGVSNAATAFSSHLKLSKAGYKSSGTVSSAGSFGLIWNATPNPTAGQGYAGTYAGGPTVASYSFSRTSGIPCRCVKTSSIPIGCTGTPQQPTLSSQSQSICSGNNVVLNGQNPNSSSGINIQWEQSADGITWSNTSGGSGSNTLSYTTSTLTASTYYRLKLTCSNSATSATSTSVLITVDAASTPGVAISTNVSNPICAGTSVILSANASNAGTNPSYQWYSGTTAVGTNANTYTYAPANGDNITCEVSSSATCATPATATSNAITFQVNALPATPVITLNGGILSSSSATSNQWYRNGTALPGATAQTYTPTTDGDYSVIVTENNCTSASNTVTVTGTSILELKITNDDFQLFPNPANNNLSIVNHSPFKPKQAIIFNLLGQEVGQYNIEKSTTNLDVRHIPAGLYQIRIIFEEGQVNRKINIRH